MKKLLLLLILGIFLISSISAFDFDNVKDYDSATKTVTIKNAFGLPIIGDDLLKAQLNSGEKVVVGLGYQKVAEFTITPYTDLNNVLKSFEFYDVRSGKKIDVEIELKYKTTGSIIVNDYLCTPFKNETKGETCSISGSHLKATESWVNFNGNVKTNEIITVGIFTNVKKGDYVEWIPTIAGVKVEEWATWVGNIATGLAGYWSFDETGAASTFRDNTTNYQHNGTLVNGNGLAWKSGASCKVGGCLDLLASNDYAYMGTSIQDGYDDYSDDTTTAFSFNFWIKKPASGTGGDAGFIGKFNPAGVGKPFSWSGDGTTGLGYLRFDGNNIGWEGKPPILDWSMVTFNWNTTHFLIYTNGTLTNTTAGAYTPSANDSSIILGFYGGIGGQDGNFSIDELGWWNRSLTQDEITFLWNGGSGRAYGEEDPSVSVTLNSPTDSSTILKQSTLFNSTVFSFSHSLTNATLYLWWSNGTLFNTTTNTTFSGNYSYVTHSNLQYGSYKWNVLGVQGDGAGTNSSFATSNYSLTVVRAIVDSQKYNTPVLEQSSQTFIMNASLSSGLAVSYINLEYNGTNYTTSFSALNSTTYQATRTLTTPTVTADGISSFSWFLVFTDGSGMESSSLNQTVLDFSIDNCSTNKLPILNFSMRDEELQTWLGGSTANTTIYVDVDLYSNSSLTLSIIEFSQFYNKTNPATVCINDSLTNSTYYMNVQVQYGAKDYSNEFYNLQNYSLNATAGSYQNITLYDLLNASAQVFTISYKDSTFLPVSNALIQISRKYVGEGVFKTVEIPLTDAQGEAPAHLQLNDVIYSFVVTKNGIVLAIFDNVYAQCQNPLVNPCTINLNSFGSSIDVSEFSSGVDLSFTLGYDSSTRTISSIFTVPSGAVANVTLNVTKEDALGTYVCSNSLVTSSGTLSCAVGSNFGNGTVLASLYKDGVLQGYGQINLEQTPYSLYGASLVMLSLLLFLTLLGAGMSDNPIITVVSMLMGIILLMVLNLVDHTGYLGTGATILWIILGIIIIITKIARRI